MLTRFYSVPASIVSILLGFLPGTSRGEDLVRFPSGRVLLYGGKTAVETGGEAHRQTADLRLLTAVRQAGTESRPHVLAVRELVRDRDGDEEALAVHDLLEVPADGAELEGSEVPMEVESAHVEIGIQFPLRLRPPRLSPDGELEVLVLSQLPVRARFQTSRTPREKGVEVAIKLREGEKPAFDFRGSPGRLESWKESYLVEEGEGLVRESKLSYRIAIDHEGSEVNLAFEQVLELESALPDPGAGGEKLARGLQMFDAIQDGMRSRKPSSDLEPRVRDLEQLVAGSPYGLLGRAARTQLGGFIELFETEEEGGRILARLLGKPAPDFTLESLDGKRVSFRELTRGKVTLLSFWGYG